MNVTERDVDTKRSFRELSTLTGDELITSEDGIETAIAKLKHNAAASAAKAEDLCELRAQGWRAVPSRAMWDQLSLRCAPMTYRHLTDIRHELDCAAPEELSDACVDLIAAFCGYPFEALPPRCPSREVRRLTDDRSVTYGCLVEQLRYLK